MAVEAPALDFSIAVAEDGYAWWYVDAVSPDDKLGITVIAFIGSVFSPYYRRARRKHPGAPEDHCAVNVALYGGRCARWTMTERGRRRLERDADHLRIGPSGLHWDGRRLVISIDETAVPWPRRVRGRLVVEPQAWSARSFPLDASGLHQWTPLAPSARVDVQFDEPEFRWSGHGYLDRNHGRGPLEQSFLRWDWSRSVARTGATMHYDVTALDGAQTCITLTTNADGTLREIESPPAQTLPPTALWRVQRSTRARDGTARVLSTLEDTPFYARSLLAIAPREGTGLAVHESLSLARFRHPLVQLMLPFRMPRRA